MTAERRLRTAIDAAEAAYATQVSDPRGRASVARIFAALRGPLHLRGAVPERLPACRYFAQGADASRLPEGPVRSLAHALVGLEPHLHWYRRTGGGAGANEAYPEGHANAMLIGPQGLAEVPGVWLGVSLLAPGVRYPDHDHPPEESYLVFTEGGFWQEGRGWFTPGIGGTFYNRPGILHAMRSGEAPLLAMWALWKDP
ncbi:transcriptional regulator [Roseovarius faecimaris]|uniref:Transcriptional regulator n=1 Tax=Roseovarius faecimaris TaxID=2494550 RepID=A0A6I6INS1_9RHOB|nr:dimethylsulfonioproprionate lyase family protein [Roseovarius faecimaris]QGX98689.1 transcriptional regulator [Roseovarius faecimaris]